MSGTNASAESRHNLAIEAEKSVLGCCLLHPDAVPDVSFLAWTDFLLPKNATTYRAILASHSATGQTDPIAVASQMRSDALAAVGGHEYLMDLAQGSEASDIDYHAKVVKERANERRLVAVARDVVECAERGDNLDELRGVLARAIEGGTPAVKPWECFSLDDYLATRTSPWAIHGLYRLMQAVLLGSFSSVGKSTIATGWINATVTGADWCGRRVRQGSVIALVGEGMKGFCLRLDAERKRGGRPIPDDQYLELVKFKVALSSPEGQAHMRALVAEKVAQHGHNPALVVIDTLSSHWSADEDSQENIAPFMRAVSQIAEEFECAVVICHHTTKTKGKFVMPELQDFRGSGALVGAADAVIGMCSTKDGSGVILKSLKSKDDEPVGEINLVREVMPLGVDEDDDAITGAVLVQSKDANAGDFDATERQLKEQREAQRDKLDQAMNAMRELGGRTTSKDAVFELMTGKTAKKRAAFQLLIDRDEVRPSGPDRGRIYYLTTHKDCPQASSGTHTTQSSTKSGAEGRTPPPPPTDTSRPQAEGAEGGGPGRKGRTGVKVNPVGLDDDLPEQSRGRRPTR